LIKEFEWLESQSNDKDRVQDAIQRIKNAPTIDSYGTWIPCSERLPEYTDEYNVTLGIASEFGYFKKVTTLRFESIKGKESRWVIPKNEVCRVIAWMPLPEPYREEKK
jgi:hypothetical protein